MTQSAMTIWLIPRSSRVDTICCTTGTRAWLLPEPSCSKTAGPEASSPSFGAKKRACVGWCFGGGWSLQHALQAPDLDGAVIYYGRLVTDPVQLKAIKAPLLGVFGDQDRGIPPKVVNAFAKALDEAGVKHTILRYDAQHAFANPSSGRYDAKAAEDAWKKVRAFLAKRLKQIRR